MCFVYIYVYIYVDTLCVCVCVCARAHACVLLRHTLDSSAAVALGAAGVCVIEREKERVCVLCVFMYISS